MASHSQKNYFCCWFAQTFFNPGLHPCCFLIPGLSPCDCWMFSILNCNPPGSASPPRGQENGKSGLVVFLENGGFLKIPRKFQVIGPVTRNPLWLWDPQSLFPPPNKWKQRWWGYGQWREIRMGDRTSNRTCGRWKMGVSSTVGIQTINLGKTASFLGDIPSGKLT